jgi:RNA polymerase sigma-70 factor (ECF subfamily)
MTLALEIEAASAFATARVRMQLLSQILLEARESRRVPTENEANLADVRAAKRGDGEAYRRVIERFQPTLARRMLRFTREARLIEELVHDVFVEAYFSLATYRGDAPFEHWLQRIATRVGYRHWTAERRKSESVNIQLYEPAVGGNEEQLDAIDAVGVALEQLPPRDRLVLTLLYLESRSVAEAADLAGWSESMVKVQAHRARKKLRAILEAAPRTLAKGD